MANDSNSKPLQKVLIKTLFDFQTRFVAFADQYKDYFDYLANKYTEDDLHISHLDLNDHMSVNTVFKIIEIHEKEQKSGEGDRTLYPPEMYVEWDKWGIESLELQIYAYKKNIESNKEEIKKVEKAVDDLAKKVGKFANTPAFKRESYKFLGFSRELKKDNILLELQMYQLQVRLLK